MHDILFWLAIYVGLFFVFNIFHRIGRFMEHLVSFRARQNFINDAYEKILSLPMEWHNDNHSENTISRVKKAADALFDFADKQFQHVEYFVMFWGPLLALLLISCLAFFMSLVIIYVEVSQRLARLRISGGGAMMDYAKRNIQGHIAYFGVSGNSRSLRTYVYRMSRLLFKWLNRRSQRKSINWARFGEVLKVWLPPVRIKHNFPCPWGMTQTGSRMV